jgi:peptidoglycan/xylan/chitin deacetylase (PgdA/CDA1 family)
VRIFRTPFVLPLLYPSLVWRIATAKKEIYLTFDDGPLPGPTDFVLETLKKFNVTGTFFCIGDNVRKHPAEFQKLVAAGHAIGNHTFNHLNGWKISPTAYVDNVQLCQHQLLVEGHTRTSNLFRPPFGRIRSSQIKLLKGYRTVMWDVLTFDYDRSLASEVSLRGSLGAARPGSIVVFHDSLKAEKNLRYVLPRFIEEMLSRGYTFRQL